ncbi:MAG: archaeosine biosynthesis radical SAM protein RaSEA [Candidatus Eremiobacteraeota bacterium]|nr:archaeosine biosynthesis radical SAM protein RaSEA [Candidatus Eremiobacteraeota bacterium]
MDLKTPAFVHIAPTRIEGKKGKRLMVILRTRGCSHALGSSGGCAFCGFKELSTKGMPVPGLDIITQFEKALFLHYTLNEDIAEIDIYNSGSFLNRIEIPPPVGEHIFSKISEHPHIRKILIESRPEYIVSEKSQLGKLKGLLGDKMLEVGIGLETKRDDLRLEVLKKGFTLEQFNEAAAVLAPLGIHLLAYVLLKPPGLSEGEAVRDAIDSIYYLNDLGKSLGIQVKVALQPTFVPQNTPLEELYFKGLFTPPKLWSVIEVLRATFSLPVEIEVGLSDEGLAAGRTAENCELCNEQARELVREFNATQDRKVLSVFSCPCKIKWKELMRAG